jgi:hypothetical protein
MAKQEQCDDGQGFFFSQAMPEKEICDFLSNYQRTFGRTTAGGSASNVVKLTR